MSGAADGYPRSREEFAAARTLIPGGVTAARRPTSFSDVADWPIYTERVDGCFVWDVDGNRYIDYLCAFGPIVLGYRNRRVNEAAIREIRRGFIANLSFTIQNRLAERLIELLPCAERVFFTKTGSDACTLAVRLARGYTGRDRVVRWGYHGWHDWYLAANVGGDDALVGHLATGLVPVGVPPELRGTNLTFHYGDVEAFDRLIADHGDRLAGVVMEPCRMHHPPPGFLEHVRAQTRRVGALLVFDEVSLGWRLARGGAHLRYGVEPDLAIFAKSLGNGHPMAAVIGSAAGMEGAHRSFISSTYWTEGVGFVAAKAVLEKMMRIDLPAHCGHIGRRYLAAVLGASERHGVPVVREGDIDEHPHVRFEHEQAQELVTLYIRLMLQRGFLTSGGMFVSLPHTEEVIDEYAEAMDPVFAEIADALRAGDVTDRIEGLVASPGFARLTDPTVVRPRAEAAAPT